MVLANQNAKLTGPDQGFLVSKALGTRLRTLNREKMRMSWPEMKMLNWKAAFCLPPEDIL
jgi:hypothetical protein